MQKTNNKWSILIWATFLSLIISVTFISISTKINKNLKNYWEFSNQLSQTNEIQNIINSSIISSKFENQFLNNEDKIIFSAPNIRLIWMKQNEIIKSEITGNSVINIQIKNWWPIKYENLSNSWIIISWKSINANIWELNITNLWWYTQFIIQSDTTDNILSETTFYKIVKKIWNKNVIKTKWTIKNF